MTPVLRAMQPEDVPAVAAMEQATHPHPWRPAHLRDALAAGYAAWVLENGAGEASAECLGYLVAMPGVQEWHLLSIAVAQAAQGRGLAQRLLARLAQQAQHTDAEWVWLEVREGNARARRLYERWGFESVGLRKHYYPGDSAGQREHAVVMRWRVPAAEVAHALD